MGSQRNGRGGGRENLEREIAKRRIFIPAMFLNRLF